MRNAPSWPPSGSPTSATRRSTASSSPTTPTAPPYAQQRTDEFRLRLAEAQAGAAQARLTQIDGEIAAEQARVAHLSTAEVKAPFAGVVWRPDVTTGSAVGHDGKLMTLIDCSSLFVTASFSSRQFDNLRPGATATVRLSDTGAEYAGTVVMALVRLDDPSAMTGEKYCNVGRRVEIRFKDLGKSPAAIQLASAVR
jgi:multidrug efflux pump subunit AcrA (membrane-fusion protein)